MMASVVYGLQSAISVAAPTIGAPAITSRECLLMTRWSAVSERKGIRGILGPGMDERTAKRPAGRVHGNADDQERCRDREDTVAEDLQPRGLHEPMRDDRSHPSRSRHARVVSQPTGTENAVPVHLAVPIASPGPLAVVISVFGLLAMFTWIAWRFGPTLLRLAGWSWWWASWACGSQGGSGYCIFLLVLGTLFWGAGTVWYARRRGRWPSPLSRRLLERVLGKHSTVEEAELRRVVLTPRRHR